MPRIKYSTQWHQYEHLHTILYKPFFIGLGVGVCLCQCKHSLISSFVSKFSQVTMNICSVEGVGSPDARDNQLLLQTSGRSWVSGSQKFTVYWRNSSKGSVRHHQTVNIGMCAFYLSKSQFGKLSIIMKSLENLKVIGGLG